MPRTLLLAALLCVAAASGASAQATKPAAARPVSYTRDVVPIFRTACLGCHGGNAPSARFSVASYEDVFKGGINGPQIVPGKSAESRLFKLVSGAAKPVMPPGAGLKPADVDAIRRWIDAGAKKDVVTVASGAIAGGKGISTAGPRADFRPIGAVHAVPSPVNALAFSPDGKTIAVGTYQKVLLCDAATGTVTATWTGHPDAVRSLAFRPDGKALAAGGGTPGAFGEVRIWGVPEGKELRAFGDHIDAVHGVAFSPDGARLATVAGDKLVKLWDPATGKLVSTLRDHSDSVLAVSFHPKGKYLATAGADRAVKVWDLETGKRIYAIGASEEIVADVAFSPSGAQLLTASADRLARQWNFGPESSGHVRDFGHGGPVWSATVSADGRFAATGCSDGNVRLWDFNTGALTATLGDAKEWIYVVRFSPDGQRVAGGTWDGRVLVWEVASKKVIATILTGPPRSAPK